MIQLDNVVKNFGPRRAVDDVSFRVEPGTVLGFLGPNGAGKTTSIRMMAGYLKPDAGRITVGGIDVVQHPVGVQHQIGYMPENTPLYSDMTVENFLRFVAEIRGFSGAERNRRAQHAAEQCLLKPVLRQPVDTLSKGYRQRTCLAQALLHDPKILLLDEPTEGLDPNQKQVVRERIRYMGREKIIMLSTHVLEEVEAVCSRVIIISNGRIVADDTPDGLKAMSSSRHAATFTIKAPADQARPVFDKLESVKQVEVIADRDESVTLRAVPTEGQPLVADLMAAAAANNWPVVDFVSDAGRLDDVFQQLTVSEDVNARPNRAA